MEISIAQAQLFFLALTRILATIIHVPVLGGRSVPDTFKIGFGLALAIALLPWQPLPPGAVGMDGIAFGFAIGKEVLIGTLAGYAASATFGALQITGHLMSMSSGFNAGQILNPAMEDSGSSMDQIFLMMAFLLFLVLDAHHIFLMGLQRTFDILPINTSLPVLAAEPLMRLTANLILAGVQMSLPVMGTLLLADLALGLLAKVAPQVQVFFLGVPLKVGVGLGVLILTLGMLMPNLAALFEQLGIRMLDLLGA